MSLLDNTQLALESAMSGSMLRQSVLSNDLANANTPGFQPEDVNFQQTLASAMSDGQSPSSVSYSPYSEGVVNSGDCVPRYGLLLPPLPTFSLSRPWPFAELRWHHCPLPSWRVSLERPSFSD